MLGCVCRWVDLLPTYATSTEIPEVTWRCTEKFHSWIFVVCSFRSPESTLGVAQELATNPNEQGVDKGELGVFTTGSEIEPRIPSMYDRYKRMFLGYPAILDRVFWLS